MKITKCFTTKGSINNSHKYIASQKQNKQHVHIRPASPPYNLVKSLFKKQSFQLT